MKTREQGLTEKEKELVQLLMSECETTSDIQEKLKRLFAGTIEQMLEAEMEGFVFSLLYKADGIPLNSL